MYRKELPRVTPESVGISSRMLLRMFKELELSVEMHGIMLARHGKIFAETWWAPYSPQLPHICHSLGKSYIGTAVGLAITDGYLSLNDRIVDIFADEIKQYGIHISDNMARLTIEHQLMMANGMSVHAASGENLLKNYLSTEVDHEPGHRFLYNTTGSCMLGAAVQKLVGKSVRQYVTEGIFDKIGLANDELEWMPFHGNGVHAAPGVATSTENNLRLGLLYLNYGEWEGKQLIDREWMKRATTRRIRTDVINNESHITDNGAGYGYQLWICPESETFKFSGGHGQDATMSRQNDLVIATHEAASDVTGVASCNVLSKYLLMPKLSDKTLPEDPEALIELNNWLHSRAIKDRTCRSVPADITHWNGIYRLAEGGIHVNVELRPLTDANVYTDFYDHDDVIAKELSVAVKQESVELVLDDGTIRTTLHASLDGKLRTVPSVGAIPVYRQTISTAYVSEEGDLIVETKFLQTCFWTKLTIHRIEGGIVVIARKERLHEDQPYFYLTGKYTKVI